MTKLKVLITLIILVAAVGAGGVAYVQTHGTNDKKPDNATTEATTEAKSTTESTTEEVTEETTTESTTEDPNKAVIEGEDGFDKDDDPVVQRESKETKELFRLTLLFIEEYDLDSDDFQVLKALMVQNLDVDYMYFQCKHNGKTEYACYTYDGNYYRDSLTQKQLKKEYEDALTTKEFYDQKQDYNTYYEYSKADLNAVNAMY